MYLHSILYAYTSENSHCRINLHVDIHKYCHLIGHSEVSISLRDLQIFHRDLQVSVQWSLHSLETRRPKVAPSLRLGHYNLRPLDL